MKKRKEHFVQKPQVYGIRCDVCGSDNLDWSEYEGLIWCYNCEIDTKGTAGIFDGPIPINLCKMMGISFDKFNLETKEIIPFQYHQF